MILIITICVVMAAAFLAEIYVETKFRQEGKELDLELEMFKQYLTNEEVFKKDPSSKLNN